MRFLILTSCLLASTACSTNECNFYESIVLDKNKVSALQDWADSEIFNRSFGEDDVYSGRVVGPGRNSLRKDSVKTLPSVDLNYILDTYEIKIIGKIKNPDAIFLGERSFSGVIITRESPSVTFQKINYSFDKSLVRDRLVSVCRQ